MDSRLDIDALALEADTTPERIQRLIEIGAIRPGEDGRFGRGDVIRSRLLGAFEAEGVTLDHLALGIRERAITLEFVDLFYPDPSPLTGRTFEDFVADVGERGRLIAPSLMAMGLPTPGPRSNTRVEEERILRELIGAWQTVDEEFTLRAARIFGDAVRRAAEGWVELFDEAIGRPAGGRARTVDDLVPLVVEPAVRIRVLSDELLRWLLERHMERTMNQHNVEALERELVRRGLAAPPTDRPPAIAFVDVTDYTRLTAEHGDELAARTAIRLGELADVAAMRHGGRVVKLLGDGVLLAFAEGCSAVMAALDLAEAMAAAGLPPAHAGVHAGPVFERDNDVYGATVNLAARIAGQAAAGTLLVSEAVRAECDGTELLFEPLGDTTLKGVAEPVSLFRVSRPTDTLAP